MEKVRAGPDRLAELRRAYERVEPDEGKAPAGKLFPFTLPALKYMLLDAKGRDKERFEEATGEMREKRGIEITLWPRLALAMEIWRRSVGVGREEYERRRAPEIANLFMVFCGIGDALSEQMMLSKEGKKAQYPKCIYSAKVYEPEELLGDFVKAMERLIDEAEKEPGRRELVRRLLNESIRWSFESAVREDGLRERERKGAHPSVKEVLEVHHLKTGGNVKLFVEAMNFLHHLENEPRARKFAEVSYAMGRATQVLDDAKDIEKDLKEGWPNLFVAAAMECGEIGKLGSATEEGRIPGRFGRLAWLRGRLPKTYGRAMGAYYRFAEECEAYFGVEWKFYKAYSMWQKDEH